ncbi:MAG TPA: hypothetical protein VF841_20415 [Anaeromyxobacter sp.]
MTVTRPRAAPFALATLSAAWIVLLFAGLNPLLHGDSLGYVAPGCMLWGPYPIALYDGARAPLYPLFLAAIQHVSSGTCALDPAPRALALATIVQLALYLGSLAYLHRALAGLRPGVRIAALAAIAFSPLHALFARQLLSEALAGPLLLVLAAHLVRFARGRSPRDAAAVFGLAALLVLTRPNLLVPLLPAVAFVPWLGPRRVRLAALALAATGLPLLAWIALNGANTGHFRLTNLDGFARTQLVYDRFDRVHREDAVLGEIMSAQHAADLGGGDADAQVVWRAMPRIRDAIDRMPFARRDPTTAGTSDLNAYLGRVSGYLVRENPGAVARHAWRTFVELWDAPAIEIPATDACSPGHGAPVRSAAIHALLVAAQRPASALARATLVLVPALLLAGLRRRRARAVALPALLWAMDLANLATVAVFGVPQVRYVALAQPLLVLAAALAVQALLEPAASPETTEAACTEHAAS